MIETIGTGSTDKEPTCTSELLYSHCDKSALFYNDFIKLNLITFHLVSVSPSDQQY